MRLFNLFKRWRPVPIPAPPMPAPIPAVGLAAEIDAFRKRERRSGIVGDSSLNVIAFTWAARMATMGELAHNPDYVRQIAATYPEYRAVAENVAEGYPTEAECVAGWAGSFKHRANMLGDFNRVGVGMAVGRGGYPYWCAVFLLLPE